MFVQYSSPDLDGHRAPKNGSLTLRDPENCTVPKPKYEATAQGIIISRSDPCPGMGFPARAAPHLPRLRHHTRRARVLAIAVPQLLLNGPK